jgi:hypothetical protein
MGDEAKKDEPRIDWGLLATAVLSAVLSAVATYLGARAGK